MCVCEKKKKDEAIKYLINVIGWGVVKDSVVEDIIFVLKALAHLL